MTGVIAAWVGYAFAVDDAALIEDTCRDAWVFL